VSEALSSVDDPVARMLARDPGIGVVVRSAATVDAALESCDVEGGTAPKRVREALAAARARLDAEAAPAG
jgi:argininosuccinate lyase